MDHLDPKGLGFVIYLGLHMHQFQKYCVKVTSYKRLVGAGRNFCRSSVIGCLMLCTQGPTLECQKDVAPQLINSHLFF